jgi:two-component system nitrogen regulation sensor histidine kinase GlnL
MPGPLEHKGALKAADREAALRQPLESLTGAISALRGACSRLKTSVDGVNTDLENANRSLSGALKIHSETAAYLEAVLAGLPTGVIVVDREGSIVFWNPAAERITGFKASEMKGCKYSETIGRGLPQRQTPLYTLATGCCLNQEEKTLTGKSGGQVPVSSSTSLIGGGDSRPGAIEVIVDLRRLRALEAEVDRVRTLAAVGELAAVVAHEVRNPLGGIKGFAGLLERDLKSNPEHLALVRRIREGIDALEGVVEDLLEAGRSTKLAFSHTELGGEVRKAAEMCEMAARGEGNRIEFKVLTPPLPVYCRVDAARIRQALTNLIRNATEAAGDTGSVTVGLRTGNGSESRVAPDGKEPRDYITIEVTDTGAGIPTDLMDRIFTPFFTTKRGGTGLGLHTARRIAGLHGGTVEYTRPESGGSKFTMTIPRW